VQALSESQPSYTVIEIRLHERVIGGSHGGSKVAVRAPEKIAFPF
jgi:hypothetical protein